MSFNPDLSKQAQEVIFSRKSSRVDHPVVTFNNSPVAQTLWQKHLGLYLDERLNFSHHIKEKISKAYRGIGVIRKLDFVLPSHSLFTIYKSFIRPHPAVMETMFSWLIMVTHGYFMVMFLYSILMVKNVTIVQWKHG